MLERRLLGVVVHLRELGEADRVVELVTAEEGRLSAVARGARKSRRRFVGNLELHATLWARLTPRRGLWDLLDVELQDARLGLRTDMQRLLRAAVVADVARGTVPEHQAAPEAAAALERTLIALGEGRDAEAVVELAALVAAGGTAGEALRVSGAQSESEWVEALLGAVERWTGRPLKSWQVLKTMQGLRRGW